MKHYNTSITEDMNRLFNPKGGDVCTNQVMDEIVPVVNIVPRVNIVQNAGQSTTGSITIYTTPTDKDFYLTGISFSFIKDVVCDSATGQYGILAFIDGAQKTLGAICILTLTAQNGSFIYPFSQPIKIDRGTLITMTGTFAAGVCRRDAHLQGYTLEVKR